MLTYAEIEQLTRDEGEQWGYPHARRVLALSEVIGVDLPYDGVTFAYAVMLHDWGAFPRYRLQGVDHALRSRQIAESRILPQTTLTPAQRVLALEAIELHDYRDTRPAPTVEALLLREADFLDMLGIIGFAREFAWGPNDLPLCASRLRGRLETLRGRFTLPTARQLAAARIAELQDALDQLEAEGFGHL